jgi:hypothetical protein
MAGAKQASLRDAGRSVTVSESNSRSLAVGTSDGCGVRSTTDSESKGRK